MHGEEASARVKELLSVIESSYELKIANADAIIETITRATVDADRILAICSGLNSWVALNAVPSEEVTIPLRIVEQLISRT